MPSGYTAAVRQDRIPVKKAWKKKKKRKLSERKSFYIIYKAWKSEEKRRKPITVDR